VFDVASSTSETTISIEQHHAFVIAAILLIVGVVQLLQGQILLRVVLIVLGCLVGPGGYSVLRGRRAQSYSRFR